MAKEGRSGLWGEEEMPMGLKNTHPLVKGRIILSFPKISIDSITSGAVKVS